MVFSCFDSAIKFLFTKLGRAVGRFPVVFIIITSLALSGSFLGYLNLRISFDIVSEFTPSDAKSILENKAQGRFYQKVPIRSGQSMTVDNDKQVIDSSGQLTEKDADSTDNNGEIQSLSTHRRSKREAPQNYFQVIRMVYLAKDGGSVLRPEYLESIQQFNSFIRYDFTIPASNLTYEADLCGSACNLNPQIHLFMKIMQMNIPQQSKSFQLTYPVMSVLGRQIQIGEFLFGVTLNKTDNHTIQDAKAILFHYGVFTNDPSAWQAYIQWRDSLLAYLHQTNRELHPELIVSFSSGDIVLKAIRTTALSSLPYLYVIMPVMLVFTLLTTMRRTWRESKPFVCIFGLVCPLLACAATFGVLFGFGMPFQPIVTVALYLALAVGVDDMYLMLHAWHRSKLTGTNVEKCESNSVCDRMGRTLQAAGPSITITSFTNAISFAAGFWATTPAIRDFCLTASVSMIMDWLLQLCLFAPVLAVAARMERPDLIAMNQSNPVEPSKLHQLSTSLTTSYDSSLKSLTQLLLSPITLLISTIFLFVYYSISIYGLTLTRIDMQIDRFLLPGSAIHNHYQIERQYLVNGVHPLFLYAMSPGDLRNRTKWTTYLQALSEIEQLNGMLGPNSTVCWIKQYFAFLGVLEGRQFSEINYADHRNIKDEFTYEYLEDFLQMGSNDMFRPLLVGHMSECSRNSPDCLQQFACRTAFIRTGVWHRDIELMRQWRAVTEKYGGVIEMVPWYYESFLMDQVASIWPSTYRTVITTVLAMLLVCSITVPKPTSVLIAMLAVFSVNIGVLGIGTLWGVDLDLLAMGALLAAVGFSVDYISHVIYYYAAIDKKQNPAIKVHLTLESIAYPTMQAAISSLLCMSVLYFHPTYYFNMFAKIVMLTVCFGLMHALIFIPISLATIDKLTTVFIK